MVASFGQRSGIGVYSDNLCEHLDVEKVTWPYKSKLSRLFGAFSFIPKLRKYDLVHIQYHLGEYMFFFLPLLWLIYRGKVVLTLHEDSKDLNFLLRFFERMIIKVADLVIVHSESHKKLVKHSNVKVIPIGVNIIDHEYIPNKTPMFFMPGFIQPWKGYERVISAFDEVKGDFKVVIMGKAKDKDYFDKIKSMSRPWLEIDEGFASDEKFDKGFRSADVVVLPYWRITNSAVCAEALGYKLPIVASNLSSFIEYLKGKQIIFDDDLVEILQSLVDDVRQRVRLSDSSKSLASDYYWLHLAPLYIKEYGLLLFNKNKTFK